MSYATLARVQALVATHTLDDTSTPTSTQVQTMIDDTSAEIDSVLAGIGVSVPVTEPSWFVDRLALLNAYGTAAMVLKVAFPEVTGPGLDPAYAFWEDRYKEGLKQLRDRQDLPSVLLGNTSGTEGILPSSYFTRNPEEEEELGTLEGASIFRIGREW